MSTECWQLRRRLRDPRKVKDLKRLLSAAESKVAQAEAIGWEALRQSWQADVERIKAMIEGKPIGP